MFELGLLCWHSPEHVLNPAIAQEGPQNYTLNCFLPFLVACIEPRASHTGQLLCHRLFHPGNPHFFHSIYTVTLIFLYAVNIDAHMPCLACGGQKTMSRSPSSPSNIGSRPRARSSVCEANAFTCDAICPAPSPGNPSSKVDIWVTPVNAAFVDALKE